MRAAISLWTSAWLPSPPGPKLIWVVYTPTRPHRLCISTSICIRIHTCICINMCMLIYIRCTPVSHIFFQHRLCTHNLLPLSNPNCINNPTPHASGFLSRPTHCASENWRTLWYATKHTEQYTQTINLPQNNFALVPARHKVNYQTPNTIKTSYQTFNTCCACTAPPSNEAWFSNIVEYCCCRGLYTLKYLW